MLLETYHNQFKRCLKMGLFLVLALFLFFTSSFFAAAADTPGCAASKDATYDQAFPDDDFIFENTVKNGGRVALNTGAARIDPNRIVIPFTQEVFVTFLYEGAGYASDFGFLYYSDAVDTHQLSSDPLLPNRDTFLTWGATTIPVEKRHMIFSGIVDEITISGNDGGDGILNSYYPGDTTAAHLRDTLPLTPRVTFPTSNETALSLYFYTDTNTGIKTCSDKSPYLFITDGDGSVSPKDMRKSIGIIPGGTEIVFFLSANQKYTSNTAANVFFTKTIWNPDVYGATGGTNNFVKKYHLDTKNLNEGTWSLENGWLAQKALDRLNSYFGIIFKTGDLVELPIIRGQKFSHVIIGAPPNDPNQWILGFDDQNSVNIPSSDTDHNDMVFRIERKTGGKAELKSTKSIDVGANDYYTSVTIEVIDDIGINCAGKSSIKYFVSLDNGVDEDGDGTWDHCVTLADELGDWDKVKENNQFGAAVTNWKFGSPPVTYRLRTIDFAALGMLGRQLRWKAELNSTNENCAPTIIYTKFEGTVATHGFISRASPSVQTNVLYSGSYETNGINLPCWTDKTLLHGHLIATRLYDPANPTLTPQTPIPVPGWGVTCNVPGDAGGVLMGMSDSERMIYYPSTIHRITDEEIGLGDGVNKIFSGTLAHYPVSANTIIINDFGRTETFTDSGTNVLTGTLGGSGTINRFTGGYNLTFINPPGNNVKVLASYNYYTTSPTLNEFTTGAIPNINTTLGLDNTPSYTDVDGIVHYKYDLHPDGVVDELDGTWLVKWVRGYVEKNGVTTKKEWLLGPIDHSVPAVQTPPGVPAWYYGTKVTDAERKSFDKYVHEQWERPTMVYVGSRDGMLHAFDGGNFRWGYYDNHDKFVWGDNPETADIKEYRGYYKWSPGGDSSTADYGYGTEMWAFIPANLISRLKNNAMSAGADQAYMDGSPALSDVYLKNGGGWKTVLLSAEGNGGDTVFCLDVTDPLHPTFMWEYADPDLYRSQSSPAVAVTGRLSNGKWVAFFVSGKTSASTYPSIYMIDISNGSLVKRISLDSDPAGIGIGGIPSGQPSAVDSDGDGYIDRIYIGTNKGYLYKVELPDDLTSGNFINCVINTDFTDKFGTTVTQTYHPIYSSPAVVVQNTYDNQGRVSEYKTRILFGTGDSPYFNDNINTGTTTYHFFAYVDSAPKGTCTSAAVSLDWVFALPAGERIFASAFAAANAVYFGTSTTETEDPCDGSGIVGKNLGQIRAMDINQTGAAVAVGFTKTTGNIVSAPVVDDNHLYVKTTGGGIQSTPGPYNNPAAMAGLVESAVASWREIFDQNERLR